MSNTTRTSLITCVMLAIVQLTGCAKNVKWEEEVLLNTGETIVVSKEVRYTIKGQPGNPLDLGYLPDFVESTSFKYGGRDYTYRGDAAIIVLAISPQKLPVLLALTGRGWATRNRYSRCAKPNYVQLVPDETGQKWTWPERLNSGHTTCLPICCSIGTRLLRQSDATRWQTKPSNPLCGIRER